MLLYACVYVYALMVGLLPLMTNECCYDRTVYLMWSYAGGGADGGWVRKWRTPGFLRQLLPI